jgi:hypothetical protein
MSTELMPLDAAGRTAWRLNALLAWLSPMKKYPSDLKIIIQDDIESAANDSAVSENRFVVLLVIWYKEPHNGINDVDHMEWSFVDSLEDAKKEVENFIFTRNLDGYFPEAKVFDTNLRKELKFKEIQTIEWED